MSNVRRFAGFSSEGLEEVSAPKVSAGGEKKESRVFAAGLHTVKIVEVTEKGPVSTDPTWETLNLKLEGTGGKTTYTNVMFPLENLLFKGAPNSFPAQQFLAFVKSLGHETSPKTLGTVLGKLFSDTSKLVGQELQVKMGYKGNHVVMEGNKFQLVQKYGRKILKDGEPALFSERDEALEWAKSAGLEVERFTSVVGYEPATEVKPSVVVNKASTGKSAAF